jgi:hypothetical protein
MQIYIYKGFPVLQFVLYVLIINSKNKYQWEGILQERITLLVNTAELNFQKDRLRCKKDQTKEK